MDIESIKQLRKQTGAGVMDAKNALQESQGDIEKAVEIIRAAGLAKAEKRSERSTANGIVYSYIHGDGQVGVLLELNCETSFVAKTDEFNKLAHELALQIASMGPTDVEELLKQSYIRDTKQTIDNLLKEVIAKTGENVTLQRFTRFALGEEEK